MSGLDGVNMCCWDCGASITEADYIDGVCPFCGDEDDLIVEDFGE
jgi:predicted RNA-binding Zn-ribbon protein involved in translation (DUF1610 family)